MALANGRNVRLLFFLKYFVTLQQKPTADSLQMNQNPQTDESSCQSAPLAYGRLRAEALRLGFSSFGAARAQRVDALHESALKAWLQEGRQGGMDYMTAHLDKRLDPRLLLPGARSVLSVALNYYPSRRLSEGQWQFAYYAYGKDYHEVMKARLRQLALSLGDVPCKICCDTVPILDRYWAWKAGLGWVGKNTNLILPHAGSYYFLGEIVVAADIDRYDTPMDSHCGTCRRCLDACPARALTAPHRLDASRCLSYLTIEHRGALPPSAPSIMGHGIYGCDRCQQACPYNRFATPTAVGEFAPSDDFMLMTPADWAGLTVERYRALFKGSAVKRAKYEGLMRNIRAVEGNDTP